LVAPTLYDFHNYEFLPYCLLMLSNETTTSETSKY